MITTTANRNLIRMGILLLIGIFFVPTFASAYRQGPGKSEKCMGMGMMHMRGTPFCIWQDKEMVEKLGLSDEQVDKLKDADFALKKTFLEMRSQMDNTSLELEKAFAQETVNDAEVLELAKKLSDIRSTMFMNRIESGLELKKILTEEQFKKIGPTRLGKFEGCREFGKYDGKMKRHWKKDMM